MTIDDRILCKITGIQSYGLFVEYEDYQGLIHISEISDRYIDDIGRYFRVGDVIYAKVIEIDFENKKLTLSYKQGLLVSPKVLKQVDIKIGFRGLEEKLDEWIQLEKEDEEDES